MADGRITFDTSLNTKSLETELGRVKRKMQKTLDDIYVNENKKIPLMEQANKLTDALDTAKAKLFEMQNASAETSSSEAISAQEEMVKGLQTEWDSVQKDIERANRSIKDSNAELEYTKEKANDIEVELAKRHEEEARIAEEERVAAEEAARIAEEEEKISEETEEAAKNTENLGENIKKTADETKHADAGFDKLSKRLMGLAKRVFVFTLITAALRKLRQYIGSVVMQNAEAQQSVAQLKAAFMTLAQPIINAVIPAFVWLVNVVTRVVAALASLVSNIFGTTAKASADAAKKLNQQAGGYGNVAKEANKAKREVMGFDELNIIGSEEADEGASGGGGSAGAAALPDFSIFDSYKATIGDIIAGIMMIGTAIALLTGSWMPLVIAGIASIIVAFVNGAGKAEELINGVKQFLRGFIEFFDGLVHGDVEKMLLGISDMSNGLKNILFAIIDSIEIYIDSFLDWLDEKTGGKLSGTIDYIRRLTHGLLDGLRTMISGVIDGIKTALDGLVEFVAGVFTQNWDQAFKGFVNILVGVGNIVVSIVNGIISAVVGVFNVIGALVSKIPASLTGGKQWGWNFNAPQIPPIPALAQGAVIPPNKEFMAVLGDQKHGTNIEAPLDTIKQAVAEVMTSGEMISLLRDMSYGIQTLCNKDTDIILDGRSVAESVTRYQDNMARAGGW